MHSTAYRGIGTLIVYACLVSTAVGNPIAPGGANYEYYNSFTTRLFPGTPFNPGVDPIDLPVESIGVFKTRWGAQTGDVIPVEVTSIVADGQLPGGPGAPPVPFELLGGIEETPDLGPFFGTYSQVVQDPSDPGFATGDASSLQSAEVAISGPFAMVLADGTVLYGEPYAFESSITSLPYAVGTELVGSVASEGPIRVQLGATPDPTTDPIVGRALGDGIVRITRIIPEPQTAVLTLLCLAGLKFSRRRYGACLVA